VADDHSGRQSFCLGIAAIPCGAVHRTSSSQHTVLVRLHLALKPFSYSLRGVSIAFRYSKGLHALHSRVSVRLRHEKRSILEVKSVFLRRHGKRTFFMAALDTSERFWQHPVFRLGRTKRTTMITDFGALVDCKAPNAFKQDYHPLNSPRVGMQFPQNLRITFCLC
jgi:hypothetical protein